MQGFGFLWSRRPVEGHFRPLIQTVYIRIFTENRIYTYYKTYICRLKIHIRCIRIQVRRNFIYTYIYIRYLYIYRVYLLYKFKGIYLYGLGQPYISAFKRDGQPCSLVSKSNIRASPGATKLCRKVHPLCSVFQV